MNHEAHHWLDPMNKAGASQEVEAGTDCLKTVYQSYCNDSQVQTQCPSSLVLFLLGFLPNLNGQIGYQHCDPLSSLVLAILKLDDLSKITKTIRKNC